MIIKNIMVIDPKQLTSEKKNLYINGEIFTDEAGEGKDGIVIDGEGLYAAPGFKDIHVHCFEGGTRHGMKPDTIGIQQGVATIVDAGSTGIANFKTFKENVIDKNSTEVLFFLNIAKIGLAGNSGELADMDGLMTMEELTNFQKENASNLVGLKVRMSGSVVKDNGINPLVYAKQLAVKAGLPLMIHIGNAPPALSEVLNILDKGDIVTHSFHGKKGGLLDYKEEFIKAADRGVKFDVGHGSASFSYNMVEKVLDIKSVDFSISTDIYTENINGPVGSLMETMTKFLPLGYSAEDIVRRVTLLPAQFLNRDSHDIKMGSKAVMSLFKIEEGKKELIDSEGFVFHSDRYFKPVYTIINGKCVGGLNA